MSGVLIRKQGHRGRRPGGMPSGGGDRDWDYVATKEGIPRTAGSHQELGEKHETDSPSEPPRGNQSC